jgi:hypothetical protein
MDSVQPLGTCENRWNDDTTSRHTSGSKKYYDNRIWYSVSDLVWGHLKKLLAELSGDKLQISSILKIIPPEKPISPTGNQILRKIAQSGTASRNSAKAGLDKTIPRRHFADYFRQSATLKPTARKSEPARFNGLVGREKTGYPHPPSRGNRISRSQSSCIQLIINDIE